MGNYRSDKSGRNNLRSAAKTHGGVSVTSLQVAGESLSPLRGQGMPPWKQLMCCCLQGRVIFFVVAWGAATPQQAQLGENKFNLLPIKTDLHSDKKMKNENTCPILLPRTPPPPSLTCISAGLLITLFSLTSLPKLPCTIFYPLLNTLSHQCCHLGWGPQSWSSVGLFWNCLEPSGTGRVWSGSALGSHQSPPQSPKAVPGHHHPVRRQGRMNEKCESKRCWKNNSCSSM